MKTKHINSLKTLKRRKERLVKEIAGCEDRLMDDYLTMTQPVTQLVHAVREGEYDGGLPLDGIYKFALNAKRVVNMVRLGMSVYKDYKK